MKPPTRWSELTSAEQYEVIKLINHLASFSPDSAERSMIFGRISAVSVFNPFLDNKGLTFSGGWSDITN